MVLSSNFFLNFIELFCLFKRYGDVLYRVSAGSAGLATVRAGVTLVVTRKVKPWLYLTVDALEM